jgi:hypothetical protein
LPIRAPIAAPPVLPPPVIRAPLQLADSPRESSSLADTESDSDDSMSLIVDTRHRWPWPTLLAIGLPAVMAIAGLIWGLWQLMGP